MKKFCVALIIVLCSAWANAKSLNLQKYTLFNGDEPRHIEHKYYGFYGVVDYTFLTNFNNTEFQDKYTLNGATFVGGFQWRRQSGVGIGFSYLNDANKSFSQLPVFLELRSHYLRSRLTPYTTLQLGYAIPFKSSNATEDYVKILKGGVTFGVSVGLRFAVSRGFAFHLGAGYQFISNRLIERGVNGDPAIRRSELFHNLSVNVGVNC